jgi:hypothetical protein
MIKTILSISGRPGLYKLVNRGKNMLIVESLLDGKRFPAYAHDKVVSLGDISIYTEDEDIALSEVFEAIKAKHNTGTVDVKNLDDADIRAFFGEVLPTFDQERVYTNDIRKVFAWYNVLINAGITEFAEVEETFEGADE